MSSFQLIGKQIVITGGSRGIGAELVRVAALQGAKSIVIGYASNKSAAEELIERLKSNKETNKTNFYPIQGDLKDQKSCNEFIQNSIEKLEGGKMDSLICSAGIMKMITLSDSTNSNFDEHFDVNVKGTLFTIQSALPFINNEGRIITFSTSVNATPSALSAGYLQYSMTKAAIEQMVKVLQRDPMIGGPERKIGINCVAPGATSTELFLKGKSDELIKKIGSTTPEGRIGNPEEVAEAVIFLATPASRWIRGQTIRINGAQTL